MIRYSDPKKWEYKEHTEVKHILLKKYLSAWIPILGKRNRKICYVDAFAGRGEYTDGTLGSPLIALEVADTRTDYFKELTCFFVEKDPENFGNLEIVLEREKTNIKNCHKIKRRVRNDEFTNVIDEIFEYLEEEKSILVPSFFFIDPFGFSGIPFVAIKRILKNSKTEVFFTCMVRDIARFIQSPKLEDTFNELFGTDEGRDTLKSPQEPELDLIYLYREQLHEVANVKYSQPFKVCSSEKIQILYYLLHVTNNFLGHSIMKDIMFNQSTEGNFAYLGPEEIPARTQIRVFNVNNIRELQEYPLARLIHKLRLKNEFDLRIKGNWIFERCKATASGKASLEY